MNSKAFEGDQFALQVISWGSFIDTGAGDGKLYKIDVHTVRLNPIALNEWIFSGMMSCRECFESETEWEAHRAEYSEWREAVRKRIFDAVGINTKKGGITLTRSQAEVFTIVQIYEIAPRKGGGQDD